LREAAGLAELPLAGAAEAADLLRSAEVLESGNDLAFIHPLFRHAVYSTLPPGRRATLHGRAAQLLDQTHASAEVVAGHIMRTEPAGDPWRVDRLSRAADDALDRGAAGIAVSLLRRAEREAVRDGRAVVLGALGRAETRVGDAASLEHLAEAYRLEPDRRRAAGLAQALSRALVLHGMADEAFTLIERELDAIRPVDEQLAMMMEAELCASARMVPGWAPRVSHRLLDLSHLTGETPGERALMACVAGELACGGVSASRAAGLALRALGQGELLREVTPDSPVYFWACVALTWCDRFAAAREHLAAALVDARRRGSVVGVAHVSAWRAEIGVREGRLAEAIVDAHAAIEASRGSDTMITGAIAPAWLILALIEQERLDEAEAVLAGLPWAGVVPDHGAFTPLMFARGSLRLARRDTEAALTDFLECGRMFARDLAPNPSLAPWRSGAARALAALGRTPEALALAEEEHELASHYGAPRALGIALRTLAAIGPTEQRIARGHEAVEVLEGSEAQLEHARALCDVGASLRRRGLRRDAREPLRLALDLSVRCGATALARQTRDELASSGARPRRLRVVGRDALTPAEMRVAHLAAEGLSNKDIAQALFVTVKTIETQLGHAYSKLGIDSRRSLSEALIAEVRPAAGGAGS
jgi:DNA-binding CsgD family transcriptional regulator